MCGHSDVMQNAAEPKGPELLWPKCVWDLLAPCDFHWAVPGDTLESWEPQTCLVPSHVLHCWVLNKDTVQVLFPLELRRVQCPSSAPGWILTEAEAWFCSKGETLPPLKWAAPREKIKSETSQPRLIIKLEWPLNSKFFKCHDNAIAGICV